MDEKAKIRGVW